MFNILRVLVVAMSGGTGSRSTKVVAAVDLSALPFPLLNSGCKIQQHSSECPPGPQLVHVYQLSLSFPHEVRLIRFDVEGADPHVRCTDESRIIPGFPVRQLLLSMMHFWTALGDTLNRSVCVARKADTTFDQESSRPISITKAMLLSVMVFPQSASLIHASCRFSICIAKEVLGSNLNCWSACSEWKVAIVPCVLYFSLSVFQLS